MIANRLPWRAALPALALIAAAMVAACGAIRPSTAPPTYGDFKHSGGA